MAITLSPSAGGDTCSGRAFVSQCATETPCGDTSWQKARSVLNRGGKSLSRGRDPAQCLTQRSTAIRCPAFSRVFPTGASAPPAESLPAPKNFFLQKRLSHKATPFMGQNHFWTGFCQRGHD